MTHEKIKHILKDLTVTYANIFVDYRPQKCDPDRVIITYGRNLIDYPDKLTTRTEDLTTTKILLNSLLSTSEAKYICVDIKNISNHTNGLF